MTIPAPLVRQYALSHGDTVLFDPEDNGLKLKFFKLSDLVDVTPTKSDTD